MEPQTHVVPTTTPADLHEDEQPSGLRLLQLLSTVWKERFTLFRFTGGGMIFMIVLALMSKNVYTATATLMPPDGSSSSNLGALLMGGGASYGMASSFLGLRTPSAIFIAVLGSNTVQKDVVEKQELVKEFKMHTEPEAARRLSGMTHVTDDVKSGIVKISVQTNDPKLSARLVQQYIESLNAAVTDSSTSQARRERIFLEERLTQIKKDLDVSSKALSQFSTKNHTFDVESQAKGTVDASMRLQAQLLLAKSELASLKQAYADSNVRVRAANARVAELQKALDQMVTGPSLDSATRVPGQEYPSLDQLPTLGLTYMDLARRAKVDELLWETLTKQYEAAKVQEAKEIPTVRVLDPPVVPDRKSGPARSVMVLLGTFIFTVLGLVYISLRSSWRELSENDERKRIIRDLLRWSSSKRASHVVSAAR